MTLTCRQISEWHVDNTASEAMLVNNGFHFEFDAQQSTAILAAIAEEEEEANISSLQPQKQRIAFGITRFHSNAAMAVYTPTRFRAASSSALQSVSQAAQLARRFSSTTSTNSLIAFTSAACHTAVSAQAATKAVVQFLQAANNRTQSFTHKTGVALYTGLKQSSSCVMARFSTGHQAAKRVSHATAAALGSFGSDVVDAAKVMARDAPAVARRMQEDLGSAVTDVNSVVKDAGVAVGKGLGKATLQVMLAGSSRSCIVQRHLSYGNCRRKEYITGQQHNTSSMAFQRQLPLGV